MALWPQSSHGKIPPIEDLRARYDTLFARLGAPPANVPFAPARLGAIAGEWVGESRDGRIILYFHGGGFIAGSPQSHRPIIGKLVDVSAVGAFSVAHRRA